MTEQEFDAWVERTASSLSEDAARLYLRACDEWIAVDDVLGPEEDELVMAGLCSHVRAAGSRDYFLEPEVSSRWSVAVKRALEARWTPEANGDE